eukprot:gnl/TRDRNA2_/TRDRNA2_153922_c0_seq2.p1 gnl/TRDRNA2_/TRDRNA2_153922_c0~~gnl/TRDRNA2_/TRDRNA2_153922_c0_seq2.p1  ORF type:complete len:294 (+),score=45.54 gnl/TRDRNA2_/TRDRNA2_153922_c0_seq2:100-981(+)
MDGRGSTPGGLYLCAQEHGLAHVLIRRAHKKIRGTPAAILVLGLELVAAHATLLALEAIALGVCGLLWRILGPDHGGDAARGLGLLTAAVMFFPLLRRGVGAPSGVSLCNVRLSLSPAALALAGAEVVAVLGGHRVSKWAAVGGARCFSLILATPLSEELYFRVALLHICANRLFNLGAACALSSIAFASVHMARGFSDRLIHLVVAYALCLRFVRSGCNLAEVVTLHMLHNAAAVAELAALGSHTDINSAATKPPSFAAACTPIVFFGTIAVVDACQLGLVTVPKWLPFRAL